MARWEHVDFAERTWLIPRENTKRVRGGGRDHVIHLSDFLFDLFKVLRRKTRHSVFCFPGRASKRMPGAAVHLAPAVVAKQVGDRQISFKKRVALAGRRNDDSLVLAQGKNGEWTPHDLRRTGATLMESLGVDDKIIDLCQNHAIHTGKTKVRRHYLHGDNGPRMREAWDLVSDYLLRVVGRPDGLIAVSMLRASVIEREQVREAA